MRENSDRKIRMQAHACLMENPVAFPEMARIDELNRLRAPLMDKLDDIQRKCFDERKGDSNLPCVCMAIDGYSEVIEKLSPILDEINALTRAHHDKVRKVIEDREKILTGAREAKRRWRMVRQKDCVQRKEAVKVKAGEDTRVPPEFLEEMRRLLQCDSVRISRPLKTMFLIMGKKRSAFEDPGVWRDEKGNVMEWEYMMETTVASGDTLEELEDSARHYANRCKKLNQDWTS